MFEYTVIGDTLVLSAMEPSDTETTEMPSKRREDRPHEQAGWTRARSPKRTMRTLLGVEAASFLLAATIHAGVLVHGYEHHEAMLAESIIGTVLLAGLAMTWGRPRSTFSIAAGVQAFALLGTLVGVWTIVVGIGPRTVPDVVYHVVIVIVLTVGFGLAWRVHERDRSE